MRLTEITKDGGDRPSKCQWARQQITGTVGWKKPGLDAKMGHLAIKNYVVTQDMHLPPQNGSQSGGTRHGGIRTPGGLSGQHAL